MRAKRLLVALALAATILPLQGAAREPPEPCPGHQLVEGQGSSCPVPGGWEVILATGERLLTHGPDPAPAPDAFASSSALSSPPLCVANATGVPRNLLLYVVPSSRTDRYADIAGTLRSLVDAANGHLRTEAAAFGHSASYRFACDANDVVLVEHVNVPAPRNGYQFSDIVSSLRTQGYASPDVKHWVWYDGSVSGTR